MQPLARLARSLARGVALQVQWFARHFLDWLFGYGERPWRIVFVGLFVMAGFSVVYWFLDKATLAHPIWALYVSMVSFVALGYGGWVELGSAAARFVAVVEALIGVFLIALFVATFTRRLTR